MFQGRPSSSPGCSRARLPLGGRLGAGRLLATAAV